jgi:hypothetical protein
MMIERGSTEPKVGPPNIIRKTKSSSVNKQEKESENSAETPICAIITIIKGFMIEMLL